MPITKAPGFFRRIAAVFYDALLLLALFFVATAIALPFNANQAFSADQYFFPLYLLTVSFIFYGWFWTHGGQTLGLRSWKLRLYRLDGKAVSWRDAALRFLAAIVSWLCCGVGFLWCIVDKNHLCWHDYLSGTCLRAVDQEKPGYSERI